jgi:hypothetical protein
MAVMTGRIVWLASYPRSGNTWMRAAYTAIRRGALPDLNDLEGGDLPAARNLFDAALGIRSSDLTPDEIDILRPRADEVMAIHGPEGRWRKIHDALFIGPAGEPIVSVAATRAAIYLVRDPRDVAVSLSHHAERPPAWAVGRLGDPDAVMAAGHGKLDHQLRQRLGTWSDHVRSWVDQQWFGVHVVRYEDCVTNPLPTFASALRAVGLTVTEAEVGAAVARSSFDRLRTQERTGGFRERPNVSGPFFRRGVAGGWVDDLPWELARRVEKDHRQVMVRFGYLPS